MSLLGPRCERLPPLRAAVVLLFFLNPSFGIFFSRRSCPPLQLSLPQQQAE